MKISCLKNKRIMKLFKEFLVSECLYISIALSNIHRYNILWLILAHININSIRNKFGLLVDDVNESVDFLMISETKIYDSFPTK